MRKLLIVITFIIALAAVLFASPILGRDQKGESTFYGTVYASEGPN